MSKISSPQNELNKEIMSTRLNQLLSKTDYTKLDLAKATGIKRNNIYNYFNGSSMPSRLNTQKIANFFDVPIETLDPRLSLPIASTDTTSNTRDNSTQALQQEVIKLLQQQNQILTKRLDEISQRLVTIEQALNKH